MEETRIGIMYWNLLKRWVLGIGDFVFRGGALRSGTLTVTALAVVLGGAVLLHHERGKGHLERLERKIGAEPVHESVVELQPGGQEPIVLRRSAPDGSGGLEFASVTTLPGLGMEVQQISIYLRSGKEINLLASPTLDSMLGSEPPSMGGRFDLPWAGMLSGSATPSGQGLSTSWQGHPFIIPADKGHSNVAKGGMLGSMSSEGTVPNVVPDGQSVTGSFEGTDFGGHWPGTTKTKVSVLLEGSRMEFTVIATNVGKESEPIGIGWNPRFLTPGADEPGKVILRLPESTLEEISGERRLPTGRLVPATTAVNRFFGKEGGILGEEPLDMLLTEMKPALLEDGASAELRFPAAGYGLRLTTVSSSIRAMRVVSSQVEHFISFGPQTNLDDPLGSEWFKGSGSAMIALAPGQSLEWKVKLELFAVTK